MHPSAKKYCPMVNFNPAPSGPGRDPKKVVPKVIESSETPLPMLQVSIHTSLFSWNVSAFDPADVGNTCEWPPLDHTAASLALTHTHMHTGL